MKAKKNSWKLAPSTLQEDDIYELINHLGVKLEHFKVNGLNLDTDRHAGERVGIRN